MQEERRLTPNTEVHNNNRDNGHVIGTGTSPLLPSGRDPPLFVTKATRGEGVKDAARMPRLVPSVKAFHSTHSRSSTFGNSLFPVL
jgi:hypothetical protein